MNWSLYLATCKAPKLRSMTIPAPSRANAMETMVRLYKVKPESVTFLCHIPLIE